MVGRTLTLLCTACVASQVSASKKGVAPIVSTELLYATYDLLIDAKDYAFKTANVDGIMAMVPVEDLKKQAADLKMQVLAQVGPIPPAVEEGLAQAQTQFGTARALVESHVAKAYTTMDEAAVRIITEQEKMFPRYKNLIPKTLGNFVLFVCYLALVLYMLMKVELFVLRMALSIFCCLCCCRCRSKSAPASSQAKKKGAAAKAATNTNAPAGKAAAKAQTKKKA